MVDGGWGDDLDGVMPDDSIAHDSGEPKFELEGLSVTIGPVVLSDDSGCVAADQKMALGDGVSETRGRKDGKNSERAAETPAGTAERN